jgi:hypothetical protein
MFNYRIKMALISAMVTLASTWVWLQAQPPDVPPRVAVPAPDDQNQTSLDLSAFLGKALKCPNGGSLTFNSNGTITGDEFGKSYLGEVGPEDTDCIEITKAWVGKWKRAGSRSIAIEASEQFIIKCVDGFKIPPRNETQTLTGTLELERAVDLSKTDDAPRKTLLRGVCNLTKSSSPTPKQLIIKLSLELAAPPPTVPPVTITGETLGPQSKLPPCPYTVRKDFNDRVDQIIRQVFRDNPDSTDIWLQMQADALRDKNPKDPAYLAAEHYFFARYFSRLIPGSFLAHTLPEIYEDSLMTSPLLFNPGPRDNGNCDLTSEIVEWGARGFLRD